jgi:hypothetical protein
MSQQNVEIVERCMKFWDHRDVFLIREFLDPNVEFDLSRNVFNPAVYRGIAGLEQMVSVIDDAWDEFRADADKFVDAGDRVLTTLTIRGKGPGSGVEVSMQLFRCGRSAAQRWCGWSAVTVIGTKPSKPSACRS